MEEHGIEYFREQYKEQQRLAAIVNARVLNRPKTKKWEVIVLTIISPFLYAGSVVAAVFAPFCLAVKIVLGVALVLLTSELYLRFTLLKWVRCYQHYAKEETRRRCKCIPSCSEYAVISLKRVYPLAVVFYKVWKRLFRTCNGEQYLIDYPCKMKGQIK